MKVQSALYNGLEIVKTNHTRAVVHDSEDAIEIAEKTRIRMLEKMKSTLWLDSKIKITPPYYSKENYLATFTPQRHLTPEQIFWSSDIAEMTPKPNSKMTRITPTGLIEGERGFDQTKECYPTEAIPFFKTLKEHFEGIQKTLTKDVKEMKEIFKQMEAEVDQNVLDKKSTEIERKNHLIKNENLIADCLSNELLYSVMNSMYNVTNFFEMHDAYTVEQAPNNEIEAEISKLKYKIQKYDHSEMIKSFSNLEVEHLNLQLKYQHLKESFRNNKSKKYSDVPAFDSVFVIDKLKEHLQGRGHTDRPLVFRVRLLKTYDEESLTAQEFYEKAHRENLEVALRKHSCYVRDIDGVELLKGSRGFNLYTISVEDMMKSSPIFLLSKASKNKSWLWHRRLNHLNFSTINDLARKDLVRGLPLLKFEKDHLCSACQLRKSKNSSSSYSSGTPSSTTIDQDAPSTSHSPSSLKVQNPIIHQSAAAGPTINDNPFAHTDNDLFVNVFVPEPSS
ncbi:retrovirus-related pol polyprotein from transposon TNT 1-94 [Tanacetum coccineum]